MGFQNTIRIYQRKFSVFSRCVSWDRSCIFYVNVNLFWQVFPALSPWLQENYSLTKLQHTLILASRLRRELAYITAPWAIESGHTENRRENWNLWVEALQGKSFTRNSRKMFQGTLVWKLGSGDLKSVWAQEDYWRIPPSHYSMWTKLLFWGTSINFVEIEQCAAALQSHLWINEKKQQKNPNWSSLLNSTERKCCGAECVRLGFHQIFDNRNHDEHSCQYLSFMDISEISNCEKMMETTY